MFPSPAYPDPFLLAWWMPGVDGKVHENRRHQRIDQGGDKRKNAPMLVPLDWTHSLRSGTSAVAKCGLPVGQG
jgi:hypothetical protein